MLLSLALAGSAIASTYPLKRSQDNRYLVDQDNVPWLLKGDSPQGALTDLGSETYAWFVSNRSSNGINALWIQLLSNNAMGGRHNGSLLDGTVPFTNSINGRYDFSTPNSDYFDHVDWALAVAETNGIVVFLNPCEMIGWADTLRANTTNTCRAYGEYLGQRYKDVPNIVWYFGNDYQTWTNLNDDVRLLAMAEGIRLRDANHLMTILLDWPVSSSLDNSRWWGLTDLNCCYTYRPTYQEVHRGYSFTNFVPNFMGEAHYEGEFVQDLFGTPRVLRLQEWWSATSGVCGQFIGSITWAFAPGWSNYLNSAGTTQFRYLNDFLTARRWWKLVPETNNVLVVSGYGTYGTGDGTTADSDYVTTTWLEDHSLAICYMPTARTITLDMAQLSGTVTVRWFDPAAGTYTDIAGSPFSNSGTLNFTPPGSNSDGDDDWVLVLETQSPETVPPIVTLTAPVEGATVSNAVLVSASAFDNLGVVSVQFQVDGADLDGALLVAPYRTVWNTLGLANGTHLLQAIALDADGNSATSAVMVIVHNSPTQVPTADLAAAFGFDEGVGNTTSDASGQDHLGVLEGPTWISTGRYGQALHFLPSSWVNVTDSDSLGLSTGMTLTAWVHPTATTSWSTVMLKEDAAQLTYALYAAGLQSDPPAAYINTTQVEGVSAQEILPLDEWSHLAATYDGAVLRLFVNGSLAASQTASGLFTASSGSLYIGGNSLWGEYFEGAIDEVRIYSRALDDDEIGADMSTPTSLLPKVLFYVPQQSANQIQQSGFRFWLSATLPLSGSVEYSTNLTSWQPWVPFDYTNSPIEFVDPATGGPTSRFYRAIQH